MKVWNYVFISLGMIFILYVFGFPVGIAGDGTDAVLNLVGVKFNNSAPSEIVNVTPTTSQLNDKLFKDTGDSGGWGIITKIILGIGAGIALTFFARAKPENLILVPLIATLALFVSSYASIMRYAIGLGQQWFAIVVSAIFLPITAGFIIALAEFLRGTD